jgi:hypothetical protein
MVLCLLAWLDKKRITRAAIGFNIAGALVFADFMLIVTWFGLP